MADTDDGSSSPVGLKAKASEERVTSVFAEFVDAARSAAESLLEEQKQQVAEKVSGIGEALRSAAHSLDQSENRTIARYVDQAADQVETISRAVRERRWNEIVADTEDFARRQPILFVLGAVATGFLAGRFLWTSSGRRRDRPDAAQDSSPSEITRAVTAAVSSGADTEQTGHDVAGPSAAGSFGVTESR
jgi:hypothetical protein